MQEKEQPSNTRQSLQETPCKRLLARDSSRETPRKGVSRERLLLLTRDSSRETCARDSSLETPRKRPLVRDSFSLQETPPPRKRLLVIDSSPCQRPLARDSFSSQETPHKRLHASDSSQETPHERLLARDSLQETSCKRLWRETPCFLQGVSCKESLARYYDKGWDKNLRPATIRTPKHAALTLPHNNQQTNVDSQGIKRHDS